MRNKFEVTQNVTPPTTDYPFGRINNNDGTGNGTPIVEEIYGDIHEFFAALLTAASITPNNLPDNATNGYQTIQALYEFASKHNIISNCEISSESLVVSHRIDIMKEGEFFIQLFNTSDPNGYEHLGSVSKIKSINSSSLVNINIVEDIFYHHDLILIKKENDEFRASTLVEGRSLLRIQEKIEALQSRLNEYIVTLPNTTIPSNTHSLLVNAPDYVFNNLVSWEINWQEYITESGVSAIFYRSNKTENLTVGKEINLLRYSGNNTEALIRFVNMQGLVLNQIKVVLTYKPV